MSLADLISDAAQTAPHLVRRLGAPTGFEPGVQFAAGVPIAVALSVDQIPADEQAWRQVIKERTQLDIPAERQVQIQGVRYWGDPATPNIYVKFGITDRAGLPLDAATLAAPLRRRAAAKIPRPTVDARVVVLADLQVGKVDRDGGTDALKERIADKLDKVDALMRTNQASDLVIVDPGDLVENSFNTTQQAHTNDLSFPEQLMTARAILRDVVDRLSARATRTRVVTVPSNHGQWRTGMGESGRAGKPGDDFGIDTHRAVAEAFAFKGRSDVSWLIPDVWQESLAIEAAPGFVLGLVHGHQWRPGKAPDWWRGQSLGDGPTAAAHMLIHGHWHHASIEPAGFLDGRPRWILGADALDGGSSWFTNLSGDQSEPSITTFTVTAGRWDNYHRIV